MGYDYLIVGAGLFGTVFAERATAAGKRVLVIDRRTHLAGNCHTEQVNGIMAHRYGPHIFHTSSPKVWRYVNRFAEFNHFTNRVKSYTGGRMFSFPINLMTLHQLWGVTTPAEAEDRLRRVRVPVKDPSNLEDWCLSQVGEEIYHRFIRGYTKKQWMKDPRELPPSLIRRLPVRLTYDDNYYNCEYQGIPKGGYTEMVGRMLKGVRVELGVDFAEMRHTWRSIAGRLVYSGSIDEFFGYDEGRLEYRTLEFDWETHRGDYQGVAQVNYPDENVAWTRVVEHKHFTFGDQGDTVITRERPVAWRKGLEPYYPTTDERSRVRFARYRERAAGLPDVIIGGRLGTYRYLDMHQVIGQSLKRAEHDLTR
jgi:UDP-galactopyranose mutase